MTHSLFCLLKNSKNRQLFKPDTRVFGLDMADACLEACVLINLNLHGFEVGLDNLKHESSLDQIEVKCVEERGWGPCPQDYLNYLVVYKLLCCYILLSLGTEGNIFTFILFRCGVGACYLPFPSFHSLCSAFYWKNCIICWFFV